MKGTVKNGVTANIKPMDGSAQLGVLTGGQYVFAELNATATDLINFNHYYTAEGMKVNLAKPCKVYIGTNVLLTNETEGEVNPPPPTPVPNIQPVYAVVSNGNSDHKVIVAVNIIEDKLEILVTDSANLPTIVKVNGIIYLKS